MKSQVESRLSQQIIYFKQKQFTGRINVQTNSNNIYKIYLCLGRLVWVESGIHSHRSWKRLTDRYCAQIDGNNFKLVAANKFESQEYYILTCLLQQNLIQREQALELVKIRAAEAFFDLLQLEYQQPLKITSHKASASSLMASGRQMSISFINAIEVLHDARQAWLIWQQKGLTNISPNSAPMMRKQDQLREEISGIVYQNFLRLLDGQRTLRDLSYRLGKNLRKLTSSLITYVEQEMLDLVEVNDITPPQYFSLSCTIKKTVDVSKPLIICIDDSPQICKIMEQIIAKCGYRFIAIEESLQALPILIKENPDFIFLDIGMPIVNGYEICSQVRRVSKLKDIPIVILTGNDGIIDRVRAKMVGATSFVAKPIEIEKIVEAINKNMPLNLRSFNSSSFNASHLAIQ